MLAANGRLQPGSVAQLITATLVALLIMLAQAISAPYRSISNSAVAIACDFCLVATLCWCFVLRFEVITETLGDRLNQHTAEGLQPPRSLPSPAEAP